MEPTKPIAEVVGGNLRRLRTAHGVTTDQLAIECRWAGLKWTDSRVSAMENGKVACTLATLVALTLALQSAFGQPISMSDLLDYDGFVKLNDRLSMRGQRLKQFFADTPVKVVGSDVAEEIERRAERSSAFNSIRDRDDWIELGQVAIPALHQSGAAEERAAKELGISVAQLAIESAKLWDRSFADERDRRAGENSNAQKRGQVSRILKTELRQAISDGND
ncbi:helix-turn-helix domain-containing protein [Nocardia sp. CA-120079]|uniref:helix-turn-helix domain-containing protein n=1 Tax=Nocardia sp. CA-120079 TaxID=3239974 RepID=UPI003D998D14